MIIQSLTPCEHSQQSRHEHGTSALSCHPLTVGKYLLPGQPCFCRSSSITRNFAKLNSANLLHSLLDFTDTQMLLLKSFQWFSFSWTSSATAAFSVVPAFVPSPTDMSQYKWRYTIDAVGAHTDPHTAKFSEQIIFQTFLCACVPSSGDKSTWAVTWNFSFQVRNCQKHKLSPALAEEQTLHTAGSSARLETEIKNIH